MIINEALPRVARPERISIRTRMLTSDHNLRITPENGGIPRWENPISRYPL